MQSAARRVPEALGALLVIVGVVALVAAATRDGFPDRVEPTTSASSSPTDFGARLADEPEVGVQFHATWSSYTHAERTEILDRLQDAGVQWVRIDVGWGNHEPDAPGQIAQFYVDRVDAAVDGARARGMRVLLTSWLTPKWANHGAGARTPPDDPQDYARFMEWAARHFRGRVDAWEIWNEPNLRESYRGDARSYAALLKAAYPAVKAGDPAAKVVIGAPAYNDVDWLRALYAEGVQGSFDVMATHPYQGFANAPPETPDDGTRGSFTHITAVHDLMIANGDADKPVWFTEFGWSNHPTPAGTPNWQWGVTDAQQGDYLIRSLRWVATNAPYVTNVFWYTERNQTSGNAHLDNYGLLTSGLEPKPVYRALASYLASPLSDQPAPER